MLDTRIFQDVEVSDACQERKSFLVPLIVEVYMTQRDIVLLEKFN